MIYSGCAFGNLKNITDNLHLVVDFLATATDKSTAVIDMFIIKTKIKLLREVSHRFQYKCYNERKKCIFCDILVISQKFIL